MKNKNDKSCKAQDDQKPATCSEFVDDRPMCLVCGKRGKNVCFPIKR